VANRTINNKQHTIRFHVDDLMSSHVDKCVNDDFFEWLQAKYGEYAPVVCVRGKKHNYLGMEFDFAEKKKVRIGMSKYMKDMIDEYGELLKENDAAPTPAANNFFEVNKESEPLSPKRKELFHRIVAKALYACK